ncbi:DUF4157 domain-containing protein [Marinomonas balearica]|uniref:Uncharacterized protein DUF4157 n=1 Tax=Marinomonas balearica TaxID=491947 RepID=A0A4R6M5T4_9GAMM|nr:DUF4157 domain-containing protein [Marinomonas balearica]TDO96718.1 uncharacterized protein DUF4157 [Marinomonas balearica]
MKVMPQKRELHEYVLHNNAHPKFESHHSENHGVPLPYCLRIGMERLSGLPLSTVRVFYNASEPASVQAHAYAQGENIYLAPNQEHHLPHELGHIVQQMKGMVKPTKTVNGVAINDDPFLENHATELGERALLLGKC